MNLHIYAYFVLYIVEKFTRDYDSSFIRIVQIEPILPLQNLNYVINYNNISKFFKGQNSSLLRIKAI